jgi:hypothetical protein
MMSFVAVLHERIRVGNCVNCDISPHLLSPAGITNSPGCSVASCPCKRYTCTGSQGNIATECVKDGIVSSSAIRNIYSYLMGMILHTYMLILLNTVNVAIISNVKLNKQWVHV